jgi:hypothetical membrane protein
MLIFVYIFVAITIFIVGFQIALALGAPLGEFTVAGKFPGKLPPIMRVAAVIQILILLFFATMVVSKAGLAFDFISGIAAIGIWFVVAFFALGSFVNITSPSKKEKMLMGPLNLLLLVSTLIVAIY